MKENYTTIEQTFRHTFASVVWSHKIQEKQADIYSNQFIKMETAKIISASLTSVGIISLIFTDEILIKIITTLISFVTVFISAFFKSFDLQTMVTAHKSTANKLLSIRQDMQLLLLKTKLRKDDEVSLIDEYKTIIKRLDEVYSSAPNTTDKAVNKARKALNITMDSTFSDDEIDSYLPKSLQMGGEV
ncbi:MAG: SLATT domain-containing protein [Proteocatella sp.]